MDQPEGYPKIYKASISGVASGVINFIYAISVLLPIYSWRFWHGLSTVQLFLVTTAEGFAIYISMPFVLYAVARGCRNPRFEIYEDRIKYVGLFECWELRLQDIEGFLLRRTAQTADRVSFYSRAPDSRVRRARLLFKNSDALLEWVKKTFTDLDEKNYREDMEAIVDGNAEGVEAQGAVATGLTEEERMRRLGRAKKWVLACNIVGGVVVVWGAFIPWPRTFIAWALIVLPFVAVFCLYRFAGFIKLWSTRKTPYPTIGFVAAGCSFVLAFNAVRYWNILEWQSFWLPFAALSLFLFLGMTLFSPDLRKSVRASLVSLLICMAFGYGSAVTLNGIIDTSSPDVYNVRVVAKDRGRVAVSPWGPRQKADWVELDPGDSDYHEYSRGEAVQVQVRRGALGIPWFVVRK